jgi:histidinol-phosphate/aromatic aminotransferase/cobyric acid decarboxylase-like protein
LHLNEYRYAHPQRVVDCARAQGSALSLEKALTNYANGPDPLLVAAIAKYVGAPSGGCVLVAAGSDEVLRAVVDTCGQRRQSRVLMGVPSYTHFTHFARLRGLELVTFQLGLEPTEPGLMASLLYYSGLMAEGCLVYLGSPNNPTGELWGAASVEQLARRFPLTTFLVDEAYVEFASCEPGQDCGVGSGVGPGVGSGVGPGVDAVADAAAALNSKSLVALAWRVPNVVVTRTFSKAFGLAALRVGYAVAQQGTIDSLAVAVSPKSLSGLSSSIARAALAELEFYRVAACAARAEARNAVSRLQAMGWLAIDTPGNFFLVYAGGGSGATAGLVARLASRGVQVRDRDELPGLAGFVRITAGTASDTDALIAAFADETAPHARAPQLLYTPKTTVAAIKSLLREVLAVLKAAEVVVWAQGGTMLGLYRHGGLIPWDDDADLAYLLPADGDPLASLVSAFCRAGLTLQRNRTDAYWQVGRNLRGKTISSVHVDIFSYERLLDERGQPHYVLGDPRFSVEDPNNEQAHCNTAYTDAELFPLNSGARFYDMELAMPARSGVVLARALGPDFMTQARVRASHGLVQFQLRDASPA